jgi:hypothetical protein
MGSHGPQSGAYVQGKDQPAQEPPQLEVDRQAAGVEIVFPGEEPGPFPGQKPRRKWTSGPRIGISGSRRWLITMMVEGERVKFLLPRTSMLYESRVHIWKAMARRLAKSLSSIEMPRMPRYIFVSLPPPVKASRTY